MSTEQKTFQDLKLNITKTPKRKKPKHLLKRPPFPQVLLRFLWPYQGRLEYIVFPAGSQLFPPSSLTL